MVRTIVFAASRAVKNDWCAGSEDIRLEPGLHQSSRPRIARRVEKFSRLDRIDFP